MDWIRARELGFCQAHSPSFSDTLIRRLVVDEVLHEHEGCVNRLAWNAQGTKLASGSDDCQVIVWNYPFAASVPLRIRTLHTGNIFGLSFLPCCEDRFIVTGALDASVQLHELDGLHPPPPTPLITGPNGTPPPPRARSSAVSYVQPNTTVYRCHTSRVKGVAVEAGDPHLFWSAAEDGTVRQYDRRIRGQQNSGSANALLHLMGPSKSIVECKSINISEARPHLMALACGDPWVRIYDRRKLGPVSLAAAKDAQPLLKLSPPHQMRGGTRIADQGVAADLTVRSHTTYAAFSQRGDKVVASYYADHAYVFDIASAGATLSRLTQPSPRAANGVTPPPLPGW